MESKVQIKMLLTLLNNLRTYLSLEIGNADEILRLPFQLEFLILFFK